MDNLERFVDAQKAVYEEALQEIRSGKKRTHWMWFIFPQLKGLGFSETSKFYAIQNMNEARAYLQHPVLGKRLVEISTALLAIDKNDAGKIFGSPDDLKLNSCMTLFSALNPSPDVFRKVIDKYFDGINDNRTIDLIKHMPT